MSPDFSDTIYRCNGTLLGIALHEVKTSDKVSERFFFLPGSRWDEQSVGLLFLRSGVPRLLDSFSLPYSSLLKVFFFFLSCFGIRIMLVCLFLYTYLPSELARNSSVSVSISKRILWRDITIGPLIWLRVKYEKELKHILPVMAVQLHLQGASNNQFPQLSVI